MGGLVGALAWLFAGSLTVGLFAGLAGFIFTMIAESFAKLGPPTRGGSGWSGGSSSGSWSSSSSSSDSSSGGGGSFGGGGASGSW
jgi:uncharacterized protein